MGWLEGILSGYSNRLGEIRRDNAAEAEKSSAREAKIYEALLNSDDHEIRGMAATGLLQSAQPRRTKGGLGGWMGEMQGNPIYPTLMKYMSTPQRHITPISKTEPGLPSRQTQGYLPEQSVPGQAPTLAQPTTSPTEAEPMAHPQPLPSSVQPPPSPPSLTTPVVRAPEPGVDNEPPPALQAVHDYEEAQSLPSPPPVPNWMPSSPGAPGSLPPIPTLGLQSTDVAGPPITRQIGQKDTWALPEGFPTVEQNAIRAARAKSLGDVEGDTAGYTAMFKRADPSLTDEQAAQKAADLVVEERMRAKGLSGAGQSVEIEYTDPSGKIQRTLGTYDKQKQRYLDSQGVPIPGNVTRAVPYSALGMGPYVNRALNQLHLSPMDVRNNPTLMPQVNQLAADLREQDALASGTGAAEARFNAPLTPSQAQATHLPAGTTGPQVAGQTIPTAAQADRRLMLGQMGQWLGRIKTQLAVLPSQQDTIGGYAPGAVTALRRVQPGYREQFARLDADLNEILAQLSRTIQGNVGTQTEQDAMRAYQTLGDIQGSLKNPLSGDTQETARARLEETEAYLQSALQNMPATPVPTAPPPAPPPRVAVPGAGPVAAPHVATGTADVWTMVNGVLHKNGVPF